MALSSVILLACAVVIYLCCESFTNGVEWLGHRARLGQTATGTILAAFGTALPESVVTLAATAFASHPSQQEIGIGAALGGPLALATIAYTVVGAALWSQRRVPSLDRAGKERLIANQWIFLAIFAVKIALGLVVFAFKPWLGVAFLAAYAAYLRAEMRQPRDHTEPGDLEPLKLRPKASDPSYFWILTQCLGAAALTFLASRLFVDHLDKLAPQLGIPPQMMALFVAPIATELPETLNAVIWVRQGKDKLAFANISGSMMIQATVPTSFGLFFTPWLLDRSMLMAGCATAAAILYFILLLRRDNLRPQALIQMGWGLLAMLVGLILWPSL
jgi:cation:H+ antiporter